MKRLAAVVLAAGRGSRFGGPKQLALLDGRPLLAHVLGAILVARPALVSLGEVVVVLGFHADAVERALEPRASEKVRLVRNPDPGRGIASSLQVGLEALGPESEGALVALGDQPLLLWGTVEALADAWATLAGTTSGASGGNATGAGPTAGVRPSIIVPRYAGGGGPNPVLLDRSAWPLAVGLAGDAGMRAAIAAHPGLVLAVDVPGSNPDVDTPQDLAALRGGKGTS
jgi:molybdenum cofactor cytidylyltransferase